MTRLLIFLFLLIALFPYKISAKEGYDEGILFLKPIVYFNSMDIKYHDPNLVGLYSRNTVSNSINGLYTRTTRYGMLISSGFGFGERYYYLSTPLGEVMNARIFYLNWDFNMGYRFVDKAKMKQDIRLGNLVNTALGETGIQNQSLARGRFGRNKEGNGSTMIQYAQWNTLLNNFIFLGLRVEHRFLMGKQQINYAESSAYQNGRDIYYSSQTGLALVAGITL
jgi:hypothetical protein